jgi:ATPase subunit of ABC transporter with duplicated ATPase domains
MNDVINIVYHVNQQKIDRYVGDYHNFERLFEEKKKQLASLADAQQAEAAKLKDFIAKKKANVATSGQAKARQKKLDKMTFVETIQEKAKPSFDFKLGRTSGKLIFEAKDLFWDMMRQNPFQVRLTC